jgi:hypothetical protein
MTSGYYQTSTLNVSINTIIKLLPRQIKDDYIASRGDYETSTQTETQT